MRAKELRLKSRRSQTEIAEVIGVCQRAYSEKERGDGRIRFSLQDAIILRNFYNNLPEMQGEDVKAEDFLKEPVDA